MKSSNHSLFSERRWYTPVIVWYTYCWQQIMMAPPSVTHSNGPFLPNRLKTTKLSHSLCSCYWWCCCYIIDSSSMSYARAYNVLHLVLHGRGELYLEYMEKPCVLSVFCTIAISSNICRFEEGPLLLSTTTKTRLRENGRMVRSLSCRIRIGSQSNFLL